MRRDVVRALRRAAGILAQVRVVLSLEERLGEGAVRLIERNDVAPAREARAVDPDRLGGAPHLDAAPLEDAEQRGDRARVRLSGRDHERGGPRLATGGTLPRHRALGQRREALQPGAMVARRFGEEGPRGARLVVHDVGESPGAAAPGCQEVPRCHAGVVAARLA